MSVTLIEHLPWLCALVATLAALELLRRLRRAQWQLGAAAPDANSVARALDHALAAGRIGNWHYEWSETSLAWSDEVFAIYARDRSLGEPPMSEAILAYHPDDRAKVRRAVRRALDHGEDFDFHARLLNEAGEMRNILVRGTCESEHASRTLGEYGRIQRG